MNYYPFHIGDYASATRHLTWDEDAAFRRLLDAYYVREGPLPLDMRAVFRLVMAATPEHREATETVLREFFAETPDGWRNKRADAEIEAMRVKRDKAAQSANKRWADAKAREEHANASGSDANACSAASEGNAPNTNTNTNTKEEKDPPASRVPPAAAGTRPARKCPESFAVTDELRQWAAAETPGIDIDAETATMRDYTFSTARSDWPGTWRNWMRKAAKDAEKSRGRALNGNHNGETAYQRNQRERVHEMTGGLVSAKPPGERPSADVIDIPGPVPSFLRLRGAP